MALIPIAPDAPPDVKEALKVIERYLSRVFGGSAGRNVDWHGRRIINAGDAVDDGDYVTKGQLDKRLKKLETDAQEEARTGGTGGSGGGGGGGGSGDVAGPSSAVNNNFAAYNGTTGKLIKDSGFDSGDFDAAGEAAIVAADLATHSVDPDAHKGEKESIEIDAGDLHLVGDELAPGNDKVYGTDGSGTKGWKANPAGSAWSVLSVGSVVAPDLVWDSNGDVIMTETPR